MMRRILSTFLLLTTVFGSAWADEVTFNFTSTGGIDPNLVKATNGHITTWTQSPFTFKFISAGSNNDVSSDADRGLKLQINASFSISTSDVVISSINLTYNDARYTATATSEENITTNLSGTTQTVSGSFQSVAFKNNTSNNIYISEITITYETIEENTYTSPKTWTFNSSRTAAATLTANSYWSQDDGTLLDPSGLYIYQLTTSNEPLYISATALLPETKGLVFTSNSVGDIFTDNTTDLTLRNGASVTIPNAKAGQTIEFRAYFWNDEVVRLTNATVKGTSNTSISVTAGTNEVTNQLTVTADGPVTLKTENNNDRLNLRYITIYGGNLTRFSSMGGQKYTYAPGATFSHTIIVDPKDALTSSNVSQLIEVTSTNSSAVSTSGATLSYNESNGRLTVSGLQAAEIGDAQLVFNYKGGAYTAKEYTTQTFQVRNTTTLSFSQSTKKVEYNPDNTSTLVTGLVATLNPADGRPITYTSSNNDVIAMAPNSADFYVKGTGTVTITASVPATDTYSAATATYTINVTAHGNITFKFLKDVTYLSLGKTVYLDLSQSGLKLSDVQALYLTVTDPQGNVAYIEKIDNDDYVDNTGTYSQLYKDNILLDYDTNEGVLTRVYVKVIESGGSPGQELKIDATIIYNYTENSETKLGTASTSTRVILTDANSRNFSFTKNEGVAFVGDVIGIPGITGNSQANESGTSYTYTSNWNFNDSHTTTKVYRKATNTPIYSVSSDSKAKIISTNYDKFSSLRDTLLVYAAAEGDVTITATDPSNNALYDTYTLHIYPRTNVHGVDIVQTSKDAISKFPYTWDFSQGFDEETKNAIRNDENYWTHFDHSKANTYDLLPEGDYTVNFGYDKKDFSTTGNMPARNFTAGDELLTPFKGITAILGSSNPSSIFGRMVVHTNAQVGEPGFSVSGGHHFYLTELADANKVVGKPYVIYVKARGHSESHYLKIGNATHDVSNTPAVYAFPMGENATTVDLEIENCDIYWIAASTEARTIGTASGTNGTLASQHLATYSYDSAFDFDLAKVYEAEKVDAWVVEAYGHSGSVFTAALSKVELEMPANTGVILRQTDNTTNSSTSAYMIAKAKNTATYTPAEPVSTNHLIGTGMNSVTLWAEAGNPQGTESGDQFLTYIMSSQYFWGRDNDKGDNDKYNNYAGYGFFKIGDRSLAAPAQMAYLVVNKNEFDDVLLGGGANPSDGGGVKMLLMFGDEDEWTNSIEDIRTNGKAESNNDEYYYTLQGNRIAQPTKSGVYIHQGKKIYVK